MLTSATFVVVLLGLPTTGEPLLAAALALAFTVLATAGFARVRGRGGRPASGTSPCVVLGFAAFVASGAGAGRS